MTIPKEKAFIYFAGNTFYCFDEEKHNAFFAHNPFIRIFANDKIMNDVHVNKQNRIHSYNDQPLIIKTKNKTNYKIWYLDGIKKRENKEKPFKIIKGYAYYTENDIVLIYKIKENMKNANLRIIG
jgi:hypothetical protein